jgi:hypothetical protein
MDIMSRPPAATLTLLLLSACAAGPDSASPERQASLARERVKLEDLTYCSAEAQDRAEASSDESAFAAAIDRCMAGLGYSRMDGARR